MLLTITLSPANSSIELNPGIGTDGDKLEVYPRTDGEYAFGSVVTEGGNETWQDLAQYLNLTVFLLWMIK